MKQINTIEDLANHFRGLSDGSIQPTDTDFGLCSHIGDLYDDEVISIDVLDYFGGYFEVDQYFCTWDSFSGIMDFPVPSTIQELTPDDMFGYVYRTDTLSMWEGEYGDLRKDLCLHIAKELEKLIVVD